MLANPRLGSCGLTRIVPVQTVIVDEASQIEIGDYLPMLFLHSASLRKMACIGDDKQRASCTHFLPERIPDNGGSGSAAVWTGGHPRITKYI